MLVIPTGLPRPAPAADAHVGDAPIKTGKVSEVKVLHEEGLANHLDIEACAAAGNGVGEALTDECAGWVLSLEIRQKLLGADVVLTRGRPH